LKGNTTERLRALFSDPGQLPGVTRHFGFSLIDLDAEAGWVEAHFIARDEFLNPNGSVQGGIVTGFLDEAMSLAALIASDLQMAVPTLEMKTSFLRPAMPGQIKGIGRVVKWGRSIAFTEGELYDSDGRLLAKATGTALPTPFKSYKT